MTKDLTTLTDTELSAWLGKVLPQEHVYHDYIHPSRVCLFCQEPRADNLNSLVGGDCPKNNDPIPLDWNVAMKWRDWAVDKYGEAQFINAMWKVLEQITGKQVTLDGFTDWIVTALPKHYLQATATFKEKDNG